MKTNLLTRLSALTMSAMFAAMATIGVAALMSNGVQDQSLTAADSVQPSAEYVRWVAAVEVRTQAL